MKTDWRHIGLMTGIGGGIGLVGMLMFVGGPVELTLFVALVSAAVFGLIGVLWELLRLSRAPKRAEWLPDID